MEDDNYPYEYEQQQQQQPEQYFKTPMEKYNSVILKITDPEEQIRKLELDLKGIVLDKKGNVVHRGEPLMNDEGVYRVIGQVRSATNRISIFTNLSDKEIKSIIIDDVVDTLVKDLMVNSRSYGIKNPVARSIVVSSATIVAFTCMKRGMDAKTLNSLTKMHMEQNTTMTTTQGNRGGIMDALNKINPFSSHK